MNALLHSGHLIDAILILVVIEAVALFSLRAARRRGPASLPFLVNLFSGAFLLLAVRAALTGASMETVSLLLSGAFVAHLAEVRLRWHGLHRPHAPKS